MTFALIKRYEIVESADGCCISVAQEDEYIRVRDINDEAGVVLTESQARDLYHVLYEMLDGEVGAVDASASTPVDAEAADSSTYPLPGTEAYAEMIEHGICGARRPNVAGFPCIRKPHLGNSPHADVDGDRWA
jgi:hypothetical protein